MGNRGVARWANFALQAAIFLHIPGNSSLVETGQAPSLQTLMSGTWLGRIALLGQVLLQNFRAWVHKAGDEMLRQVIGVIGVKGGDLRGVPVIVAIFPLLADLAQSTFISTRSSTEIRQPKAQSRIRR